MINHGFLSRQDVIRAPGIGSPITLKGFVHIKDGHWIVVSIGPNSYLIRRRTWWQRLAQWIVSRLE